MADDWYGHRNPFTGDPEGDKDEWLEWDYLLLNAFQIIEDFTDPDSGILQWKLEDPSLRVTAERYIHPWHEAVESKTGAKNYKASPGERFRPVVDSARKDGSLWTMTQWFEEKAKEKAEED